MATIRLPVAGRPLIGLAALLAATELRLLMAPLPGFDDGYAFPTYLPAVALAGLLAGPLTGAVVALAGGLLALWLFARLPGTLTLRPHDVFSVLAFWALSAWTLALQDALRRTVVLRQGYRD